jgi:hypothetical protein
MAVNFKRRYTKKTDNQNRKAAYNKNIQPIANAPADFFVK